MPTTAKKPKKPRKDFPLTPHNTGRWCKKIAGVVRYFGAWDDPDAALAEYLENKDSLQLGIDPRKAGGVQSTTSLAELVNGFLSRSNERVEAGELSAQSFADYRKIGSQIVGHFGRATNPEALRPTDFAGFRVKMAATYGPARLSKIVTVTRMMISWAYESELLEKMPRFGPDFSVAGKKAQRLAKVKSGKKLLTPAELALLIAAADAKWKAVLHLAINCAFGPADISRITLGDVKGEWIDLPRGKTGVSRRCWLWPETRSEISVYLKVREKPKPGNEELLILSAHGGPIVGFSRQGSRTDLIGDGFKRLAEAANIHREGMGLYWCRHSFQTVADEVRDPVAVAFIMGHADHSMAGHYREKIGDDRLKAVAEHVRRWAFPPSAQPT